MKKEKKYESILAISAGFIALYFLFKIPTFLYVAFTVICIGLFSSYLTSKVHFAWSKLAEVLGYVNSRVLLFVVFYFFLTPLALIRRLVRKEKVKETSISNFIERNQLYEKKDLENPW